MDLYANTVEYRYNAIQYDNLVHAALKELRQDIYRGLYSQKAPHTSP